MQPFSLNIKGALLAFERPAVMGIINVTPDSFYASSRHNDEAEIESTVLQMLNDGADFIDVGAYSTRPGYTDVSVDEELSRLETAIKAIKRVKADIPVSVDTFRAEVAKVAISQLGADIINDVSCCSQGESMINVAATLKAPYILTHSIPDSVNRDTHIIDNDIVARVLTDLASVLGKLQLAGVNDVIIDPGFGFDKSLDDNYRLLSHLDIIATLNYPILVGLSRKSMLTKPLGISADDAMAASVAANTIALLHQAAIIRTHDVKATKQAIEIYSRVNNL